MTPVEYEAARASPQRALLTSAQFDRAGLLIEIFLTLARLFVGRLAYDWPHLPNKGSLFGGRSPIELMQSGGAETMRHVLGHLFALVGGLQLDMSEREGEP